MYIFELVFTYKISSSKKLIKRRLIMEFTSRDLLYLGEKEVISKAGKKITFVVLANPETFEKKDFFKGLKCDETLKKGDKVFTKLTFNGNFCNADVTKLS